MTQRPFDPKTLVDEAESLVEGAAQEKRVLRMYAATAIYRHCPGQAQLFEKLGRRFGDIDLAAYDKDRIKIEDVISSKGYDEDLTVSAFGGRRLVFNRRVDGMHCDVFLGRLEMSHVLSFDKRLELDYPTAPLADLLLSKVQIFQLNDKDAIDTILLLREHQLGKQGREVIDAAYVSDLCAKDWGLWRTVTGNLQKIGSLLPGYSPLSEEDRTDVSEKLASLKDAIDRAPKNLSWRIRDRVGESRKWYNEVEDLYR